MVDKKVSYFILKFRLHITKYIILSIFLKAKRSIEGLKINK